MLCSVSRMNDTVFSVNYFCVCTSEYIQPYIMPCQYLNKKRTIRMSLFSLCRFILFGINMFLILRYNLDFLPVEMYILH